VRKRTEIVLIGPPTAGKSTLALAYAKSLGITHVNLDAIRPIVFKALDYDFMKAEFLFHNDFEQLFEYWRSFECSTLEICLQEFNNCIFDVGAGYVIQSNQDLIERINQALSPFVHVIQIAICQEPKTAEFLMHQRLSARDEMTGYQEHYTQIDAALVQLISRHEYSHYATHTLYTHERTVEDCIDELLML
jgi:shikimate kinase